MAAAQLYHYDPSFIVALVALVEAAGYACRALSTRTSTLPYAIQTFALLLGPACMAASIYMMLSKIIIALDADIHSLVPVKVLPKVFIFCDLVSLAAQLTGAAYLVDATLVSQQRTAQLIIVSGLSFQIYFFGFFTSVLHIVHSRVIEAPTRQSTDLTMPWKRWIIVLYLCCGFILIRSIYRVIEYATGPLGVLQSTEIYFYVFDAGSMFIVAALLNIFHPRQLAGISKDDLRDVETVIVTPSKPVMYQPPRYIPPPPFLPSHANLRNRGPYFHHPKSQYRSQSYIQYPPPMHYYQQRRPPTMMHQRPRTNRTNKSFNPSLSSGSSVVSIYNPQTGQYEPFRR
ncbi:RTA1 like protein-domain-containing protein [Fusarium flagelliforme]|uniref:RTA1 like protein-domain-containing protein n=1 Tax=Fusarium flagelliforme TaxID=2675880 RepID=UPI001E8DEC45|nr:RTA1 like protein-domain-containing protein [Fusarium flagelliforme]KAH7173338.1 RTA1 like protein-domain-containing protein [Fusarium flagelliforme]